MFAGYVQRHGRINCLYAAETCLKKVKALAHLLMLTTAALTRACCIRSSRFSVATLRSYDGMAAKT